jgi:hypothetical protein
MISESLAILKNDTCLFWLTYFQVLSFTRLDYIGAQFNRENFSKLPPK